MGRAAAVGLTRYARLGLTPLCSTVVRAACIWLEKCPRKVNPQDAGLRSGSRSDRQRPCAGITDGTPVAAANTTPSHSSLDPCEAKST